MMEQKPPTRPCKNHDPRLHRSPRFLRLLLALWHLPRTLAIAAITLYQHTLSPDHGLLRHLYPYGCCLHEPTCSEFTKTMIMERGVMMGTLLGMRRIISCNPWSTPSREKIGATVARQSGTK